MLSCSSPVYWCLVYSPLSQTFPLLLQTGDFCFGLCSCLKHTTHRQRPWNHLFSLGNRIAVIDNFFACPIGDDIVEFSHIVLLVVCSHYPAQTSLFYTALFADERAGGHHSSAPPAHHEWACCEGWSVSSQGLLADASCGGGDGKVTYKGSICKYYGLCKVQ